MPAVVLDGLFRKVFMAVRSELPRSSEISPGVIVIFAFA
jgi:hypothetical protein